ncbi:hypothetical protein C8J57DRAFT_1250098 [Mycena rebaudengoi]|nr:hypothetical protein C8J57DRAFT_1250098 [Mycena rebaudengoi]
MFNYCFPLDFRQEQKLKLKCTYQNQWTVDEYIHELEELYNTIGDADEWEKVDKLWNSLNPKIQKGLWLKDLSSETCSWDDVKYAAHVLEQVEKIGEGRRGNGGPSSSLNAPSNGGGRGGGGKSTSSRGRDNRCSNCWCRKLNGSSTEGKQTGNQSGTLSSGSIRPQEKNPMNRSNPKSDKRKAELRAAGLCYNCKKAGHVDCNCPDRHLVKSGKKGKPPGFSSHNAEFQWGWNEPYIHVEGAAAVVETLPLGAIRFDLSDSPGREEYFIESELLANPDFKLSRWYAEQCAEAVGFTEEITFPRFKLEDSLALGVEMALGEGILTYPGDTDEFLKDRFSVLRCDESMNYWI